MELVVQGGVDRGKFLKCCWTSKPSHGPFSASERLVGVFSPVVEPAAGLLPLSVSDVFHCGAVGSKSVGHDRSRSAITLHRALQKLQSRLAVPLFGDENFENLAFVIDGAPEIVLFAIDPHEDLVEVQRQRE